MELILIILVVLLVFGGFPAYYGTNNGWGYRGYFPLGGLLLLLLVLYLLHVI